VYSADARLTQEAEAVKTKEVLLKQASNCKSRFGMKRPQKAITAMAAKSFFLAILSPFPQ
jgi:hypothetical protein